MRTRILRGFVSRFLPTTCQARCFLLAGVLCLLTGLSLVQAHMIVFKDGYTLKGNLKAEKITIFDSQSGVALQVDKLSSMAYSMDDKVRQVFFSKVSHALLQVYEQRSDPAADPVNYLDGFSQITAYKVPAGIIASYSPWTEKWDRTVKLQLPEGGVTSIRQHLSILTPYYARIDARGYKWTCFYLTKELPPDMLRDLIVKYESRKLPKGKSLALAQRYRIYRFMAQAGLYEQAATELTGILKDFPDQEEKIAGYRENLKKLLALELADKIEEAQKCGRHDWAYATLTRFPMQLVDETVQARLRGIQAVYDTAVQNLKLAQGFLTELPGLMTEGTQREALTPALEMIQAELNSDTVSRLETFLSQAQQAQRDRAAGRTPAFGPEQLLALAVSGWLMGNAAAEPRVETALHLWHARQFLLEYQKTAALTDRTKLRDAYQKQATLAYDELARLVRYLPPPEPLALPGAIRYPFVPPVVPVPHITALSSLMMPYVPAVPDRFELQASLPWIGRVGPSFQLQLPPEYHPGRNYPVLIALHEAGEKPEAMLQRWSALAAQHGYILVAPEWDRAPAQSQGYQYTLEEHRAVLDVLRDLRQHLQVDSDRVFLTGWGEGGTMAFDVGLAHPDQFAGVIPIGGLPKYYATRYWANAQYLPFYAVVGEMNGDVYNANYKQFDGWLSHGYYSLLVAYHGRGAEWFAGELPQIFDWMNHKKRENPVPELGKVPGFNVQGNEFQIMRPSDNHFYWLSGEGLNDRHINNSVRTWSNRVGAATLQARINNGNQINVHATGFRKVVVWLAPGMIDFQTPARVFVNLNLLWANRKIVPDPNIMLEDLYLRGDRQRQFVAKVELTP
jgi:pimeloyl-ACP methyl ester carboxylesterase